MHAARAAAEEALHQFTECQSAAWEDIERLHLAVNGLDGQLIQVNTVLLHADHAWKRMEHRVSHDVQSVEATVEGLERALGSLVVESEQLKQEEAGRLGTLSA
eukprot:2088985-Rhodomonas_salina.1